MSGFPQLPDADLSSLMQQLKQQVFSELNKAMFGTIVAFDASLQTVRVRLNFKRAVYNQEPKADQSLQTTPAIYDYPVLLDCPAMVLSGGTGVLTMPIAEGDSCLVLFHDRDFDLWFTTANVVPPNSPRMHSLSDGMVIVGFRNKSNPVAAYSPTDIELRNLGGLIGIASKIALENEATSLLLTLTAVMNLLSLNLAALTQLNAKTGPSAAAQITAFGSEISVVQAQINSLLK